MRKPIALSVLAGCIAAAAWLGLRPNETDPALPRMPARVERVEEANEPAAVPDFVVTERKTLHWTLAELGADPVNPAWDESEAEAQPDPETTSRTTTIRGRLVWTDTWRPIADVRVQLTSAMFDTVVPTRQEPLGPVLHAARATTSARGEFILHDAPHDQQLFVLFEKGSLRELRKVRWAPALDEQVDLGTFYVESPGIAVGRVVATDGTPIDGVRIRGVDDPLHRDAPLSRALQADRVAGAERFVARGTFGWRSVPRWMRVRDAHLPFPETESFHDGRFELRGLRAGTPHLVLQKDTHTGLMARVVITPHDTTDLGDIYLPECEPFEVRVVNTSGRPVRDVEVSARPADWMFGPEPVATDPNGIANIWLPRSEDDDVKIRVQLRRSPIFTWHRGGDHAWPGATVSLPRSGRSHLLTLTLEGAPVDDARLAVAPADPNHAFVEPSPGEWLVRGVTPGGADPPFLYGTAPGCAPAVARFVFAPEDEPAELVFVPALRVNFVVVDDQNAPVEGAVVELHAVPPPMKPKYTHYGSSWHMMDKALRLGKTRADGTLRADGIWDSHMRFSARHPRLGRVETRTIEPFDGQRIELRILRPTRLRGFLARAGGRRPLERWTVEVERLQRHPDRPEILRRTGDIHTTVADADGAFELADLSAAPWEIRVQRAPGTLSAPRSLPRVQDQRIVWLKGGETRYIDIRVDRDPRGEPVLVGAVTINGQPVVGARMRWIQESSNRPRIFDVRTDEGGRFAFHEIPEELEDSLLVMSVLRNGEWLDFDARVIAGNRTSISYAVKTAAFEFAVFDALGQPLANRMIRMTRLDAPGPTLTIVADAFGYLRYDGGLPPGRYRLKPQAALEFVEPEVTLVEAEITVRAFHAVPAQATERRR